MNKKILIIIFGILSSFAFINNTNEYLVSFVLGIFFITFYNKYLFKYKRNNLLFILSVIFSLLMIFGYSYKLNGNSIYVNEHIIESIISFIGYTSFFYVALNYLNELLINIKINNKLKNNKLINLFNKNPFLFSFILLFICYLPYIISYYPGVINYDAANQIKEVMGIPTRYLDSIILPNNLVSITNFNPVIHTLLIGGLFKFGHLIGNVNIGMFIYTLIQVFIVIGVFSYSIYYMYKKEFNKKLILTSLLLFALIPVFPMYSITGVKDVIFSSLIFLYIIKLYDFIKYSNNKKDLIGLLIVSIFIILFRNNGIHTLLLSFPFLLFINKFKKEVLMVFIILLLFNYTYTKGLLPILNIPGTSIREGLSIPFQQTARTVKYHSNKLSESDKEVIDKILGYEDLGKRYRPNISDPVKNKFNKNTTDKELKEYFNVWFKGLLKYPSTYVDATINTIYGYFYPNTSNWYLYNNYNTKLEEAGFDYKFNSLNTSREVIKGVGNYFPNIPIFGLIVNIAINIWVCFIMMFYLIINKKNKYIIILLPCFALLLACMAGPVNTYFRYILPIVFSMPFLLNVLFIEINKHKS